MYFNQTLLPMLEEDSAKLFFIISKCEIIQISSYFFQRILQLLILQKFWFAISFPRELIS